MVSIIQRSMTRPGTGGKVTHRQSSGLPVPPLPFRGRPRDPYYSRRCMDGLVSLWGNNPHDHRNSKLPQHRPAAHTSRLVLCDMTAGQFSAGRPASSIVTLRHGVPPFSAAAHSAGSPRVVNGRGPFPGAGSKAEIIRRLDGRLHLLHRTRTRPYSHASTSRPAYFPAVTQRPLSAAIAIVTATFSREPSTTGHRQRRIIGGSP